MDITVFDYDETSVMLARIDPDEVAAREQAERCARVSDGSGRRPSTPPPSTGRRIGVCNACEGCCCYAAGDTSAHSELAPSVFPMYNTPSRGSSSAGRSLYGLSGSGWASTPNSDMRGGLPFCDADLSVGNGSRGVAAAAVAAIGASSVGAEVESVVAGVGRRLSRSARFSLFVKRRTQKLLPESDT